MHLKGGETFYLDYTDPYLNTQTIKFRNPGKSDTLIHRQAFLQKLTHVSFQSIMGQNETFVIINKDFLVHPGDSIELQTAVNDIAFVGASKSRKFIGDVITYDRRLPSFKLKLHRGDVGRYHTWVDSVYRENKTKIGAARKAGRLTGAEEKDFQLFNEVMAAAEYFSLLTLNDTKVAVNEASKQGYLFASQRLPLAKSIASPLSSDYILKGYVNYQATVLNKNPDDLVSLEGIVKKEWGEEYAIYLIRLLKDHPKKNTPGFKLLFDSLSLSLKGPMKALLDSTRIHLGQPPSSGAKDLGVLTDHGGKQATFAGLIASQKGRVVVVDFWASWCVPCKQEMPKFQAVKQELKTEPITFLAISIDNDKDEDAWREAAMAEKLEAKTSYRLKGGGANPLLTHYQIDAVPHYMVFDRAGNLLTEEFVRPSHKDFKEKLKAYVAE